MVVRNACMYVRTQAVPSAHACLLTHVRCTDPLVHNYPVSLSMQNYTMLKLQPSVQGLLFFATAGIYLAYS